jgi:hypothetical protein
MNDEPNKSVLRSPEWLLLTAEMKSFFLHTRSLHFIPLIITGIPLVLWREWATPFIIIILVVVTGLEGQFNNILYRSRNELEAFAVMPVPWRRIVVIKNLATAVLAVFAFLFVAVILLYFVPDPPAQDELTSASLYVYTLLFPLIAAGNSRSLQFPRRLIGWQVSDLAEGIGIALVACVLSGPFLVLQALGWDFGAIIYGTAGVAYWYAVSIKKTAGAIALHYRHICEQP